MSDKYVAYVGTYTHGTSKGIHIYDVNVEEGTLSFRKEIEASNSSHLCCSLNGNFLYSIIDKGVGVYEILPDGDLKFINKKDIDGMRGRYISVDKNGKYLFIGGYHDGKVTVMHTHHDGWLGSIMDGVFHRGIGSVAERNSRPHVTCVIPTPDNKFVCAVDNGIDQVKIYNITEENKLDLADTLRCPRESAPLLMQFSPDGKTAYLLSQISNSVTVYSYTVEEGASLTPVFEKLQEISTTSDTVDPMHDAASGMCFSPDGKYLFTSTAGDNTVTMFSINENDGTLTKEFALPISGEYPKDITMFPDGQHIAVVNNESNSITTFKVDYKKKLLIMKGKPLSVDTPTCIHMYKTRG
jgi:6-phosphogluconolactonase